MPSLHPTPSTRTTRVEVEVVEEVMVAAEEAVEVEEEEHVAAEEENARSRRGGEALASQLAARLRSQLGRGCLTSSGASKRCEPR